MAYISDAVLCPKRVSSLPEVRFLWQELAKKDADLVEVAARKQRELDELSRAHEAAIAQMQQDREQAAAVSAKEAEGLAEHVAALEGKLADAIKQLTGKEENLDSMRSQARMRENRLSELAADLEAKGARYVTHSQQTHITLSFTMIYGESGVEGKQKSSSQCHKRRRSCVLACSCRGAAQMHQQRRSHRQEDTRQNQTATHGGCRAAFTLC